MKNKKIDMLNGPLVGKIVIFALPLALSSILQQLFNSADLAVVGRFDSDKAMAAVGSNSSLVNLIVSLFLGLSVGANVVVARLIGQGRKDKANEAVHTVVLLAVISGFIILGVGEILAPILLGMMNVPDDVLKLATLYLRIFFFAMPFIEIYDFGSAVLRSKGDSTRPLYALITAGYKCYSEPCVRDRVQNGRGRRCNGNCYIKLFQCLHDTLLPYPRGGDAKT